jgi:hypothetical protein
MKEYKKSDDVNLRPLYMYDKLMHPTLCELITERVNVASSKLIFLKALKKNTVFHLRRVEK